ncbi:hypothetical protein J6590_042675 [Homalodisca vitripennis]|nr:hypothetical protein J6590_042675 [Homalodisca vitripennis]
MNEHESRVPQTTGGQTGTNKYARASTIYFHKIVVLQRILLNFSDKMATGQWSAAGAREGHNCYPNQFQDPTSQPPRSLVLSQGWQTDQLPTTAIVKYYLKDKADKESGNQI